MKKGFTLVELLAVIALIGVLSIIVVPNIMRVFTDSTTESMKIQENSVLDAANLFINDHCTHPVGNKKGSCSAYVFKATDNNRYLCLNTLQNIGYDNSGAYLDNVYYKTNVNCVGFVYYESDSEYTAYKNGKAYLQCGSDYMTDGIGNIVDMNKEIIENGEKKHPQIITICGGKKVE